MENWDILSSFGSFIASTSVTLQGESILIARCAESDSCTHLKVDQEVRMRAREGEKKEQRWQASLIQWMGLWNFKFIR